MLTEGRKFIESLSCKAWTTAYEDDEAQTLALYEGLFILFFRIKKENNTDLFKRRNEVEWFFFILMPSQSFHSLWQTLMNVIISKLTSFY